MPVGLDFLGEDNRTKQIEVPAGDIVYYKHDLGKVKDLPETALCDLNGIQEDTIANFDCWWDEGDGPRVGAYFTGRNETPGRTWETRSQVIAAERGRRFAFVVGDALVRWEYTFATSKFDLTLFVLDDDKNLHLTFEYDSGLFDPTTVRRSLATLQSFVEMVVGSAVEPKVAVS